HVEHRADLPTDALAVVEVHAARRIDIQPQRALARADQFDQHELVAEVLDHRLQQRPHLWRIVHDTAASKYRGQRLSPAPDPRVEKTNPAFAGSWFITVEIGSGGRI